MEDKQKTDTAGQGILCHTIMRLLEEVAQEQFRFCSNTTYL